MSLREPLPAEPRCGASRVVRTIPHADGRRRVDLAYSQVVFCDKKRSHSYRGELEHESFTPWWKWMEEGADGE